MSVQQQPIEEFLETGTINTIDWTDDYLCFKIPNRKIGTYKVEDPYTPGTYIERDVLLYDIIDINTIEVSTKNPSENEYVKYKTYIKGTDFDVGYGYTASGTESNGNVTIDNATLNRGLFLKFYQLGTYGTNGWQLTKDSFLYVRFKARGNTNYIFQDYILPDYDHLNGRRKFYVQMKRELVIKDTNIVLSSVKPILIAPLVQYDASYVTLSSSAEKEKALKITTNQIELQYGSDYYTYKKVNEDGKTEVRINLLESTNSPILSGTLSSTFTIEYNQDITADYYYNDALDVMKKYQIPQTNYTISVQDISYAMVYKNEKGDPIIDYSSFYPKVGTRVPIYDNELNFNGLTGFISSVTYDLLEPQNTSLTVSNYKDKFEDLFSKITQATIAMENKEYTYDRINNIIDSSTGGRISIDLLQESLDQANAALSMSNDNNYVEINKNGITVWGKTLNENGVPGMLRITCGGIFTANEQDEYGSYIWNTAITPDFINADLLRAGSLDTRVINIFNSSEPRFMWNEQGLHAYGLLKDGWTDYNTYVRYNHEGLQFREKTVYEEDIVFNNLITQRVNSIPSNSWTTTALSTSTVTAELARDFTTRNANVIECLLSSKYFGPFVRGHKYYYRMDVAILNVPQEEGQYIAEAHLYSGIYQHDFHEYTDVVQYSTSAARQWNRLEGYIEMNSEDSGNAFLGVVVSLTALPTTSWSVRIRDIMLIDVTDSFNETSVVYPTLSMFSALPYYVGNGTSTYKQLTGQDLEVYNDAVVLDWDGLRINAQNDAVVLTAKDGLVVNSKYNNIMNRRLQMGMWQEADGKHYGLRGYNQTATKVFQLDENGLWLSGILDASKIVGRSSIHIGLKDGADSNNYSKTSYNFNVDENGNVDAHTFNIYQPGGTNKLLSATTTGLHIYSPNNATNPLSTYSSDGVIFYKMGTTNPLLKINGQGMYMYDGAGSSNPLNSYTSAGLGFYYSGTNQKVFNIGTDAMTFYNLYGQTSMKLNTSGISLYGIDEDDDTYLGVTLDASGLTLYDEYQQERVWINDGGIYFYNSSECLDMMIYEGAISFYQGTSSSERGSKLTMKVHTDGIDMYALGQPSITITQNGLIAYNENETVTGGLQGLINADVDGAIVTGDGIQLYTRYDGMQMNVIRAINFDNTWGPPTRVTVGDRVNSDLLAAGSHVTIDGGSVSIYGNNELRLYGDELYWNNEEVSFGGGGSNVAVFG
jgi:hypothetical protein